MATSLDPSFVELPNFQGDSVLGLGSKENSAFGRDSYFGTFISTGGPSNGDPVFGLYLAASGSELIRGGRDNSKFSGSLTFINLNAAVSIFEVSFAFV